MPKGSSPLMRPRAAISERLWISTCTTLGSTARATSLNASERAVSEGSEPRPLRTATSSACVRAWATERIIPGPSSMTPSTVTRSSSVGRRTSGGRWRRAERRRGGRRGKEVRSSGTRRGRGFVRVVRFGGLAGSTPGSAGAPVPGPAGRYAAPGSGFGRRAAGAVARSLRLAGRRRQAGAATARSRRPGGRRVPRACRRRPGVRSAPVRLGRSLRFGSTRGGAASRLRLLGSADHKPPAGRDGSHDCLGRAERRVAWAAAAGETAHR